MNKVLEFIGLKEIEPETYNYLKSEAETKFLNFTNQDVIPIRAIYLIDRIIAGNYLSLLFQTNKLPDDINYDLAAKALKIDLGDTSVDFGSNQNSSSMTDEAKLQSLIDNLNNENNWKVEALKWRKLNW